MPLLHLVIVALIQGVTEFLPVSSSGHLILLPALTGAEDQGVVIDVAVHVGTLFAVIVFFRRDVAAATAGLPRLLAGDLRDPGALLSLNLIVATIPVVLCGALLVATGWIDLMRDIAVIGWTMLVFGVILWWADATGARTREAGDWTPRHAIALGLWQAAALIPGVSRSGITITGARFLGYGRPDAVRVAMLMSIPAIAASGVAAAVDIASAADAGLARDALIAAVLSFGSALAALWLMTRLLRFGGFAPYAVYRIALGGVLLLIAYG